MSVQAPQFSQMSTLAGNADNGGVLTWELGVNGKFPLKFALNLK